MKQKYAVVLMVLGMVLAGARATASEGTDMSGTAETSSGIPIRIAVGPSLGLMSGAVGFGGDISVAVAPMSGMPFYVGLESGYYNWSSSSSIVNLTGGMSSVPLLATALYSYNFDSSPIHPYIGVALGTSFTGEKASGVLSASGNSVQFEGLLRPGVSFDMGSSIALAVEPKLGILGSSFVFLPHVDVVFGL